jgi:hypothetical protein
MNKSRKKFVLINNNLITEFDKPRNFKKLGQNICFLYSCSALWLLLCSSSSPWATKLFIFPFHNKLIISNKSLKEDDLFFPSSTLISFIFFLFLFPRFETCFFIWVWRYYWLKTRLEIIGNIFCKIYKLVNMKFGVKKCPKRNGLNKVSGSYFDPAGGWRKPKK